MRMEGTATTHDRVRRILIEDWDPHEVIDRPHAHGTYDAWVEPLLALLATGPTEDAVIAWLHERECETMCFPSLGTERLRRVAGKLVTASPRDVPRLIPPRTPQ